MQTPCTATHDVVIAGAGPVGLRPDGIVAGAADDQRELDGPARSAPRWFGEPA